MRYLGIDYGEKRVGLALSDESGQVAFPEANWQNDDQLVAKIGQLCRAKAVGQIVLGESLDYRRAANPVMTEISRFREKLGQETGLAISLEPEWLTSAAAARGGGKKEIIAGSDAAAAALILQTFLDRL